MRERGFPAEFDPATTGIVIVDHGSRREEANRHHEAFVTQWRQRFAYPIVEPAHMEITSPTIGDAFEACVAAGADMIVVAPYFLWPGNHWDRDLPALATQAAKRCAGVSFIVTAPLGLHPLLMDVVEDRVVECLAHASSKLASSRPGILPATQEKKTALRRRY